MPWFDPSEVRRRVLSLTIGIGGIAAIIASSALHLFESHSKSAVPSLAASSPIEAGQWLVALRGASVAMTTPDGRPVPKGQRAIVVETEMTNRTVASSNDFYSVLRLDRPASPSSKPMLYLDRDRTLLTQLHPGLAEKVTVAWTVPAEGPPPAVLKLAVAAKTFKPRDNLYAAPGWFNEHVVGTVDLPLLRRDQDGSSGG
ncbi:hypothetical protein SAMN05519103_08013 [Rhizobiales bacterium GAS113]|nr:hypothetical protein SAMN05519103_08013 [Rhizobiales bacterium GAS113]